MFNTTPYWRIWITIGIIIFFITLLIKGFSLNMGLIISAISSGGTTLLIEALVFKKFIWRKTWYFLSLAMLHTALGGTWEGELISDYVYPENG